MAPAAHHFIVVARSADDASRNQLLSGVEGHQGLRPTLKRVRRLCPDGMV
jgi:hypothetical protein